MVCIPMGAIELAGCDFLFDHTYPNVLPTLLKLAALKLNKTRGKAQDMSETIPKKEKGSPDMSTSEATL